MFPFGQFFLQLIPEWFANYTAFLIAILGIFFLLVYNSMISKKDVRVFRQVLIKLFLDKCKNVGVKQYDSPTTRLRKILSTNSIPWIYTKRQGGIAVDVKKMCNYVNPIAQTSFSPESALKILGIKCDFIDQMWFRGKNISYGIDLDEQETLAHIFNQCDKNEGLIIESQQVREE